jgi:acyl-CoA synthetase (NDP forming)
LNDSLPANLVPLRAMLSPRSIAVVGASNEMEYGGRVVFNLKSAGYTGAIYPVNPRQDVIQGLKAYKDVRDIPGPVDLAVLVVSSRVMPDVVRACGEKGIKAGTIISAGYAEQGEEGLQRQNELVRLAHSYGMRLSGPNSLGVANLSERMFAAGSTCDWDVFRNIPSSISVISQSGALAFTNMLTRAQERGIGFRNLVSVGNQGDLSVVDFVQYMVDADDGTRVIAIFLEGLPAGEGRRLVEVARRAARLGKAILVFKVARSEQGQQAARSHTAALIGKDAIYDGVFRQCGIVRVTDIDDLWEAGQLFASVGELQGDCGIGFLSNSGGMNSVFVDACGGEGVPMPAIQPESFDGIADILAGRGSSGNPVDASGQLTKPSLQDIIGLLERDSAISMVGIGCTTMGSGKRSLEVAQHVCEAHAKGRVPYFMLWASGTMLHGVPNTETAGLARVQAAGIPVFHESLKCARSLRWLREYSLRRRAILAAGDTPPEIAEATAVPQNDFMQGMALLERSGIPTASTVAVAGLSGALDAAATMGYPVVLKIDAPGLMHKTEIQGVVTGVADAATLKIEYGALWKRTAALGAQRRVIVQQQVGDAVEFIFGGVFDKIFGPVVMVGTGGIWVELAEDVAFRAAPIDTATAHTMLAELRGAKLLRGLRGAAPRDTIALVSALVRFSELVASFGDRVAECEINPVLVLPEGQGVKAVDVLIVPS